LAVRVGAEGVIRVPRAGLRGYVAAGGVGVAVAVAVAGQLVAGVVGLRDAVVDDEVAVVVVPVHLRAGRAARGGGGPRGQPARLVVPVGVGDGPGSAADGGQTARRHRRHVVVRVVAVADGRDLAAAGRRDRVGGQPVHVVIAE